MRGASRRKRTYRFELGLACGVVEAQRGRHVQPLAQQRPQRRVARAIHRRGVEAAQQACDAGRQRRIRQLSGLQRPRFQKRLAAAVGEGGHHRRAEACGIKLQQHLRCASGERLGASASRGKQRAGLACSSRVRSMKISVLVPNTRSTTAPSPEPGGGATCGTKALR